MKNKFRLLMLLPLLCLVGCDDTNDSGSIISDQKFTHCHVFSHNDEPGFCKDIVSYNYGPGKEHSAASDVIVDIYYLEHGQTVRARFGADAVALFTNKDCCFYCSSK